MTQAREQELVTDFLVVQVSGLANPVFAVNAAAKTLQPMSDPVDFILSHLGNLAEAQNAHFVQRFFYRGSDTFDEFEVVTCIAVQETIDVLIALVCGVIWLSLRFIKLGRDSGRFIYWVI